MKPGRRASAMILPLEVKCEIQVQAGDANSAPYGESRVEEMADDELIISWPTYAGERIPFREFQTVRISFSREQKTYEFDATVLDVIDDPVPLLSVRPTGPLRTIQRREDVRVRVHVPVELAARVVGLARYKDARGRAHNIRGETVTLSAGGFAISHPLSIAPGTVFEVKMKLPGEDPELTVSAQVVRCDLLGKSGELAGGFEVGFSFNRISPTARARLVRFIFGLQRELRLEE